MTFAYAALKARDEAMRRARNAAWYRDAAISGRSWAIFRDTVREYVVQARAENRIMWKERKRIRTRSLTFDSYTV